MANTNETKTNLVSENGNHEFSWLKGFDDTSYQIAIVGRSNVAFEAHIRKLRFRCNMDCHVASLKIKTFNLYFDEEKSSKLIK